MNKQTQKARKASIATFVPESEYVAVADYHVNAGDININMSRGRLYSVIERAPNGWSLIKIDGQEGWVPSGILRRQRKESIMSFEEDGMCEDVRSLRIVGETFKEENNNVAFQNDSAAGPPVSTTSPIKSELYETICDYSDDDEGMLSFERGEKVQVLEKDDGGWWLAMIGVKKGWVPSNFLVKVEAV